MSIIVCKLPKAGLGNQLFPLMHALIFGRLNDLPVIITGYHAIKIGPWLRGEKSKRQYKGFFTFEKSWLGEASDRQKVTILKKTLRQVTEPDVKKLSEEALENRMFIFQETGDYQDFFRRLKEYRDEVIETLYSIIDPAIITELNKKEAPVIGIHIRMGDFRKLKDGETYQSGHVRPPQSLFVDLINRIRKINGTDLPVSVFTDGYLSELDQIFCLKKVRIVNTNSDLLDLLLLSKSSLIIPTHGSTFSAWGVFLSKAAAVLPFNYSKVLRPDFMYEVIYEGEFQEENDKMIQNIKNIQQSTTE